MSTGSLWSRGPQIVYARVVTPQITYETMVVSQDGAGLKVRHAPHDVAWLAEIERVEDHPYGRGWFVTGVTPDGGREMWWVEKVCGCRQAYQHETLAQDAAQVAEMNLPESAAT